MTYQLFLPNFKMKLLTATASTTCIPEATNGEESKEKTMQKSQNPMMIIIIMLKIMIENHQKMKFQSFHPKFKTQNIDSVVLLGTYIKGRNDVNNEGPNKVDLEVELRKKNDANIIMEKLIKEQKNYPGMVVKT